MLTPDSLLFVQAAKKAALKGTNASTLKKVRTSATFHRCVTRSPSAARNSRVSWVSRTARADGRTSILLSPVSFCRPRSCPLFLAIILYALGHRRRGRVVGLDGDDLARTDLEPLPNPLSCTLPVLAATHAARLLDDAITRDGTPRTSTPT